MITSLPIYKIELKDNDEMLINSLVDEPAHRHYFIAQKVKQFEFSINEEKREVTGVVIAAEQPIYYYSEDIPECYIVFTANVIRKIAEKFFNQGKYNLIDVNHSMEAKHNSVTLLETYFTKGDNMFNVANGSWIITYKINDNNLWEQIKQGKIKGYSIAGNFSLEKLKLNKKPNKFMIMEIIDKVKRLLQEEMQQLRQVKDINNNVFELEGELKEGSKLWVITADSSKILAPKGEYLLVVDEKVYKTVVDETGTIVSVEVVEEQQGEPVEQQIKSLKQEVEKLNTLVEQRFKEFEDALMVAIKDINIKLSNKKPVDSEQKIEYKLKIK